VTSVTERESVVLAIGVTASDEERDRSF
jgi:hypothetical protein